MTFVSSVNTVCDVLNFLDELAMSQLPLTVEQTMPVTGHTEVQEVQPMAVTEPSHVVSAYVSNGHGAAASVAGCENGGFLQPPPAHMRSCHFQGHRGRGVNPVCICVSVYLPGCVRVHVYSICNQCSVYIN